VLVPGRPPQRHPRARSARRCAALLVALLAAVTVLAGCGAARGIGPTPEGDFVPAAAGTLTVATLAVPTPGFWEGTAAAPSGGFEDELAQELAHRFGLSSVRVVLVPLERMTAGDLGGADLALAQLTPTAQRSAVLGFSVPYLAASPAVLVRTGTAVPDVYTAKGLRWAVTAGSTLADTLDEQVRPDPPVALTPGQDVSVALLEAGNVDAVLLDVPVAMVIAERSRGRLSVVAQLPGDDSLAVAVPAASANQAAVDTAIRRFTSDGTLVRIADRWLGTGYPAAVAQVPLLRTSE